MKDKIRRLQKDGEYRFIGLSRSESKKAATELSKAAMEDDRRNREPVRNRTGRFRILLFQGAYLREELR